MGFQVYIYNKKNIKLKANSCYVCDQSTVCWNPYEYLKVRCMTGPFNFLEYICKPSEPCKDMQ